MGRFIVVAVLTLLATPAAAQPPPELAAFLKAHATGKTPWKVTVHEIGATGRGFLGRTVMDSGALDPTMAKRLIVQLVMDTSFDTTGIRPGNRCWGASLGLRLSRDGADMDLLYECGNLELGEHGAPTAVSTDTWIFIHDIESWALPCVPLTIDALDVTVCMPRGAQSGGGGTSMQIFTAPRSPCPDIAIGTGRWKGPTYVRKVGTFELTCDHRDVPGCIKVCDTLKPLPNSTATEPFPSGPPIVEIEQTWRRAWGISIWSDGTVLFAGHACPKVRSQRAQLTHDQLSALLAGIKATGFLTAKTEVNGRMYDGRNIHMSATIDGQSNQVRLGNSGKSAELDGSRVLIEKAVGKNPCDPD